MHAQTPVNNPHLENDNYTYPQFVIDEKTGHVEVNFIEKESGRVVRHIPATELRAIIRSYCSSHGINFERHWE
ncbi:MAG: flagellar protein FlaG [Anaerolineae bacterium]|nr:flagellar protein FlaG [Anaerolineae bacterium]